MARRHAITSLPPLGDYKAEMTEPERETREALSAYKDALILTSHRSWSHCIGAFFRNTESLGAERHLKRVRELTKTVVNSTEVHRRWLRQIVLEQPDEVREQDRFMDLLDEAVGRGAE